MSVDKRLEELAGNPNPLKDDIAGLAAALLRARKALLAGKEAARGHASSCDEGVCGQALEEIEAALADPELEELLR